MTTTDPTTDTRPRSPRPGVSVRVRITATVALLTAAVLAASGFAVYVVELGRVDDRTMREATQELDEFEAYVGGGEPGTDLTDTLRGFLASNVPDDDELLIGWLGDEPALRFAGDPLVDEATFLDAVRPMVPAGASTRIETAEGEVLVSTVPVRQGRETGGLVVVNFLRPDRAALRDTMETYAIVASLSLLLVCAVAFWRAGRLLRPLRALRETADEIGETDLARRLPLTGNDDVTALTRTFNHMLDRLEAAFTGQRQLLDDAGHELRTPLTILQGHLELLDAADPVEVEETRRLLLDETDRMARLVDDLILLAKTERLDFLTVGSIDVAALTDAVAAKASGLGDRQWSVDQVAVGTVRADADRITQALLQLAHNAVKYTRAGDQVAVGSVRDGDLVLWWVRDTGPGVARVDRERIFERFGRGHGADASDKGGFGLGLSIVSAIARAHGGDAWLDGGYDGGARFVVAVPADGASAPRDLPGAPTSVERPAVSSPRPAGPARTPQEV